MKAPADSSSTSILKPPVLPACSSAATPAAVELCASAADRDSVRTRTSAFSPGGGFGDGDLFTTVSFRSAVRQLFREKVLRAQTVT